MVLLAATWAFGLQRPKSEWRAFSDDLFHRAALAGLDTMFPLEAELGGSRGSSSSSPASSSGSASASPTSPSAPTLSSLGVQDSAAAAEARRSARHVSIFDYYLTSDGELVRWDEVDYQPAPGSRLFPSVDVIRSGTLVADLIHHGKHVFVDGPTGSGKTILVEELLYGGHMPGFEPVTVVGSLSQTGTSLQDALLAGLSKRRAGVWGPATGTVVALVDRFESFGSASADEKIRRWMDFGTWYTLGKEVEERAVEDIQFLCVGDLGRRLVSPRLLRHFNVVPMFEPTGDEMVAFLRHAFARAGISSPLIDDALTPTLEATAEVYTHLKRVYRPAAGQLHYTLSMCALDQAINGLALGLGDGRKGSSLTPGGRSAGAADGDDGAAAGGGGGIRTLLGFFRAWAYEMCRAFGDRLGGEGQSEYLEQVCFGGRGGGRWWWCLEVVVVVVGGGGG